METDKHWDIPNEYLVEIGRVIVRWSKLEGLLELCLIELLGKDITESRSLVVFTHMSFPQKMDVLGALVSEIIMNPSIDWLNRYKPEVEPLLRDAQTRRNEIAHAKWGMDSRGKVGKHQGTRFAKTPQRSSHYSRTRTRIKVNRNSRRCASGVGVQAGTGKHHSAQRTVVKTLIVFALLTRI